MTVLDVLEQVRELKPNQYSDETLASWIRELDGKLRQDVFCHYGDAQTEAAGPYTPENMNAQLLVPHPHTELYVSYLCAKVDYQNAEYERYNNGIILFNAQMNAFKDAYNREHMPKQEHFFTI